MVIVFDLDDTLFAEMAFVRSAYRKIAKIYGRELLDPMLKASTTREAFDSTGLPIDTLLKIYRTHEPDIRLPWQSLYTLSILKKRGHSLGLITDGRSVTQRNKIKALGLDRFIDPELIFISEETGAEKLTEVPFEKLEQRCGAGKKYMYVGDNPAKDFVSANRRGWQTVCLLNGTCGENLHTQNFKNLPEYFLPQSTIEFITELTDFGDLKKL